MISSVSVFDGIIQTILVTISRKTFENTLHSQLLRKVQKGCIYLNKFH